MTTVTNRQLYSLAKYYRLITITYYGKQNKKETTTTHLTHATRLGIRIHSHPSPVTPYRPLLPMWQNRLQWGGASSFLTKLAYCPAVEGKQPRLGGKFPQAAALARHTLPRIPPEAMRAGQTNSDGPGAAQPEQDGRVPRGNIGSICTYLCLFVR